MAAVAWQAVKARLVSALPAVIPTATVYDGPRVSGEDPAAYLTVGSAPSQSDESGGSFSQDVGPDGYSATETGSVVCELGATTGATDIPDAFGLFAAVAAWVQADMALGGTLSPGSTCTVNATVVQAQTRAGAVQRLILSVNYFTRL